ncbi:MAG TPA: ABC transporter permease subunit [Thermoanaerobaculia bacterium]|nr:ABC transporter permease subunit [Thermoanaerobaculia bacterium]
MNRVVFAETLRRHVTNAGFLAYAALLAILALGSSRFDAPGSLWPSMIVLLALITGAGLIGPEFSSGTLQLILVKPVNRSVYLISRVAGVVAALWIAIVLCAVVETIGRLLFSNSRGLAPVGIAAINTAAEVVLMCALLALFGSLTRAYFNVAIYIGLQIALAGLTGLLGMLTMSGGGFGFVSDLLKRFPQIVQSIQWIDANLFPDAPRGPLDRNWLLLVASNAAIALVAACFLFRRREVPYGAD